MQHSFNQIFGHQTVISSLQNAIKNNKISHAYIINSEDSISRDKISHAFAKTLMCEAGGNEPCMVCASCKAYDHGNNVDVSYIDSEDKKSIGIEKVRDKLVSDIEVRPYNNQYKIYIIKDADTMTDAAQNAILKTIEEPHEYAIIILLSTNVQKFLPTIRSRCTIIDMKPIPNKEMNNYIVDNLNIEKKFVDMYMAYSQGNIEKLENMINSDEFIEFRKETLSIGRHFTKLDIDNMIKIKEFFNKNESKYQDALHILYLWYRDVLMIKNDIESDYIINKDMQDILYNQAEEVSFNYINRILENISYIKENMRSNLNLKLATHVMLMNIK